MKHNLANPPLIPLTLLYPNVGQDCRRKVVKSICQTSQFWTLFSDPGTPFGRTLRTLDLAWNSLCPRVAALLGNGPIWNHSRWKKDSPLDIILNWRSAKVIRNLKEWVLGKEAEKKSVPKLSRKSLTCLPAHKYHVFWRVSRKPFEWLWGHFGASTGVVFQHFQTPRGYFWASRWASETVIEPEADPESAESRKAPCGSHGDLGPALKTLRPAPFINIDMIITLNIYVWMQWHI